MREFKKIENDIFFSGCENCKENCCEKFKFIPLILEDFKEVYKFFPIFFSFFDDEIVPIIELGENKCRYFKNNKCKIYEFRPPGCKTYPIIPYFDEILIDISCPGVGNEGEFLANKETINPKFYHSRIENLSIKRENTLKFTESIKNDLVFFKNNVLDLFIYPKKSDNKYILMHQQSIKEFYELPNT